MSLIFTRTQIANRALQKVGAQRIADGALLTEDSKNASEVLACYDIVRMAELRRNIWRFSTRKAVLSAIDYATRFVNFPLWSATVIYQFGAIVIDSTGQLWTSNVADEQTAVTISVNTPAVVTLDNHGLVAGTPVQFWTAGALPTGLSIGVTYYVIAAGLTTNTFEVSATLNGSAVNTTGTQSGTIYIHAGTNLNNTPSDDAGQFWQRHFGNRNAEAYVVGQATPASYYSGQMVYDTNGIAYVSLQSGNSDAPPSTKWRTLAGATLSVMNFVYPLGAGPLSQSDTRNIFMLPNGFLRQAPDDPPNGSYQPLGSPVNVSYNDYLFEGGFLTSRQVGPLMFRFSADVADPTQFDPMFVEGLACRIAGEVCEPLTQSTTKLQGIAMEYKNFMGEARLVNGIETGPTEPPEDSYLINRL